MGITDISTSEEIKASNYPKQCKLADHWNKFGERSNGTVKGEFNVFFIKAEVILKSAENQIRLEGRRQITNYWAGPASMALEQKQRFSEFTSIDSVLGIRINNFTISKRTKLTGFLNQFSSKTYQLGSNYILHTNDLNLRKTLKHIWDNTKVDHYSKHNLKLSYNRKSGILKLKFYKMLTRINELEKLTNEFNNILKELKKST